MLRGYYIHFGADKWIGVKKKIEMQIKVFQQHFDVREINIGTNERSFIHKLYDTIPFVTSNKHNLNDAYKNIENPDFLYVRAIWSDNQYMDFFRSIRAKYPKCKIIVEIPTYPYDNSVEKMLVPRERWSRRKYKKYVDCIATYSEDKEIFGVPVLSIKNGIDVNSVKPAKGELDSQTIRLVAVSIMIIHHGYERVLKGLGRYYAHGGRRNIVLHMVGEGPELQNYKKIVEKEKLSEHVIFHGQKVGRELDAIYDESDIVLTTFGFYKVGVYCMNVLKSREALAKGLPLVNGCTVDIFKDEPCEYSYDFPNDNSVVNIQEIIDFYDRVYENRNKEEVIKKIRKIAYEKVDMAVVMQPIIEYIVGDQERSC